MFYNGSEISQAHIQGGPAWSERKITAIFLRLPFSYYNSVNVTENYSVPLNGAGLVISEFGRNLHCSYCGTLDTIK